MSKNKFQLEKDLPTLAAEDKNQDSLKSFQRGLQKTRALLFGRVWKKVFGEDDFETEFLEPLFRNLLLADVGFSTANRVKEALKKERKAGNLRNQEEAELWVKKIFLQIFSTSEKINLESPNPPPLVIFLVGVNGAGKTTTLAKLASFFQKQNRSVLLAAADTFRAAAVDQLKTWGEKINVRVYAKEEGGDPAAVVYEAIALGKKEQFDVVLCDTSGRLHNKKNLMEELAKMQRVAKKLVAEEALQTWLILDANTGQNAIQQTKEFLEAHAINGLIMTKLDGTAKGGILLGIANEFRLPICFVGLGERVEDLQPFDAKTYISALLQE